MLAGPADGEQAKNLLPYDIRRQLVIRKFQEIDTNKDGQLDRVELTGYAVKQFIEMDTNKDRFLTEEELKNAPPPDPAPPPHPITPAPPPTPPPRARVACRGPHT